MSFSLTDHGGHQEEIDYLNSLEGQQELLEEDRAKRLRDLTGKYVLAITGKASGKRVFKQEQRFKRKKDHYWTQYLTNAVGYEKLSDVKAEKEKLKYGNPVILKVLTKGNLKEV